MRGISWLAANPVSFSRRTLLHGVSRRPFAGQRIRVGRTPLGSEITISLATSNVTLFLLWTICSFKVLAPHYHTTMCLLPHNTPPFRLRIACFNCPCMLLVYIRRSRIQHLRNVFNCHLVDVLVPASTSGFFAEAVEYFWLCARTVEEPLRRHIFTLSVSVCCMDFVESAAVCAPLLRTRAKRRKRFWGTSTCKSKTTERAVPHIACRLAYPSKKMLWIF